MSVTSNGHTARGELTFSELCAKKPPELEALFMRGTAPELRQLAGAQYDGQNLTFLSRLLRIRKFIKGFVALPAEASEPQEIDGYNLWARQNGVDEPWEASSPKRHGLYKVSRVKPGARDAAYPHALLLDYGRGDNPWHHPGRFLRDYVVSVSPRDPRLLLGVVHVALGPQRVFGGYFAMVARREPVPE